VVFYGHSEGRRARAGPAGCRSPAGGCFETFTSPRGSLHTWPRLRLTIATLISRAIIVLQASIRRPSYSPSHLHGLPCGCSLRDFLERLLTTRRPRSRAAAPVCRSTVLSPIAKSIDDYSVQAVRVVPRLLQHPRRRWSLFAGPIIAAVARLAAGLQSPCPTMPSAAHPRIEPHQRRAGRIAQTGASSQN
jgi:hypothetical protein